jgi:NAD-dependent DNA ligase
LSGETYVFKFEDLLKYLNDEEFLNNIYWFAEKTSLWVKKFIINNKELLDKLFKIWLNFNVSKFNKNIDSENEAISWKHFSITWTFLLTRENIIEELEKQGAIFDGNPTKQTEFILIGENPWSKKEKAEKNQIKIIQWRENIIKEFDFLKNIKSELKTNIKAESLF